MAMNDIMRKEEFYVFDLAKYSHTDKRIFNSKK